MEKSEIVNGDTFDESKNKKWSEDSDMKWENLHSLVQSGTSFGLYHDTYMNKTALESGESIYLIFKFS